MNLRRLAILAILGAAAASLNGCNRPLFPENLPSSQYSRYNQLHGQQQSARQTGANGEDQPDLRERLRPLDQP